MTQRSVDLIVIHCSATPPTTHVDVKVIDRWHRARGWLGCGYHYVIRRDGELEEGRPLNEAGAHAAGFNRNSIGICLAGGVNAKGKAENNFEGVQFKTLKSLVYQLKCLYPDARVVGHRDLSPDLNGDGVITPNEWFKQCPSFNVQEWLNNVGLGTEGTTGA